MPEWLGPRRLRRPNAPTPEGFRLPGPGAEPAVDLQRLCQPRLSERGLAEGGVQQADPVGVRPHETDQRTVDGAGVAGLHEVSKQLLTERLVLQCDRGGGHLAHEDRPQV